MLRRFEFALSECRSPGVYDLILKASDKGTPENFAELNIKVNVVSVGTTPPSFQDRGYKASLSDNTNAGRKIGEVTIMNNPQKSFIQYQILSGNVDNAFCIDYSRKAYTQKSIDFDKWKQPNFELTIALMYSNSISATELWAAIPKENDNPPVFVGGSKAVEKVLLEDAG